MGAVKRAAEDMSSRLGFGGEITDEVLKLLADNQSKCISCKKIVEGWKTELCVSCERLAEEYAGS
jgi:hypothetical protein